VLRGEIENDTAIVAEVKAFSALRTSPPTEAVCVFFVFVMWLLRAACVWV